jgi:hypothetical protein
LRFRFATVLSRQGIKGQYADGVRVNRRIDPFSLHAWTLPTPHTSHHFAARLVINDYYLSMRTALRHPSDQFVCEVAVRRLRFDGMLNDLMAWSL